MAKTLCIYHANCADGLGAAWTVHWVLSPAIEFVGSKYGDQPPYCKNIPLANDYGELSGEHLSDYSALAGRDVLIVDFSYPLPVLRAMAREARSVLVLDHHKTAREDLAELPFAPNWSVWRQYRGTGDGQGNKGNLAAIFDLERSGAGLAWDYLSGGQPRPRIIDLIEDRDLWKFKFGDETRAFHAVLASYDWTNLTAMFERLTVLFCYADMAYNPGLGSSEEPWEGIVNEGKAILRANVQAVAAVVAASRRTIKIAGHTVPCANVPGSMASDAGHLLCEDILRGEWPISSSSAVPTFSATYYDGADGRRHFSLRSLEDGADVGQVAQQMAEQLNEIAAREIIDKYGTSFFNGFAGGGHEHAAGFDAPLGWEGE